jgi:hypothetical protein
MGSLVFQATLGGQVNLNGPNTASTFDIAVPATTGTMVTTGDSGTVTNTMLAASAYNTPGTIGSGTANTGAFTTLSASSTVSGTGFSTYLASPPAIGGTAAAAGTFTTLSGTTSVTTPIVKSASSLTLQSNGTTTAVTIDTSQNVGIGTSSPGYKLNVGNTSSVTTLNGAGITLFTSGSLTSNVGGVLNFRPGLGQTTSDIFNLSICAYDHSGDTNADGLSINGSDGVSFSTGGNSRNERMRIDSSGNVLVGITSANANGGILQLKSGITFPATQVLATDANTLDDYEEGTWTPNVQNTSSSSTWSTKTGRYTKIGRFVYCSFVCDGGNSGTAGGALVVSGLPFTYGGTSNVPTLTGFTANGLASTEYLTSRTQNGSTSFSITTVQGPTITVQSTFAAGTIVYEV